MTDINTITKTINLIFVAGPQASMLGACNICRERERERERDLQHSSNGFSVLSVWDYGHEPGDL